MWEIFRVGGPMMWPLLACSVTALAVILERFWFWRKLDLDKDNRLALQMLQAVGEGKSDVGPPAGLITAMLNAGIEARKAREKAMELIALEGVSRMRRGMNVLDTIISAAPMLGIMGTVLGIISSFDMLGTTGVSDPKAVIAGIAQALITTVFGLGIAVVAIFPYNHFNARIESAIDLLELYSDRLDFVLAQHGGE